MISLIVYGRNDNYGYNLHKRAAISFNCMAEMLTDKDDEIIFVDYNTPDDFPTFPEAILDTLTPNALKKLRILRARPAVHERFAAKSSMAVLEAIARNIALRRSNPRNRWILNTNTDIVFVPQRGQTLTQYVRDLPGGIYHAPRLEIPETLWESLDRREPKAIIDTVRKWGRDVHLDEIVYANDRVMYDGPGDFQLMERDALFKVHGYHEEMLLGWHLDSNTAVRMQLYYGKLSDAGGDFFAYHCDHTRQISEKHGHNRLQNSIERFVDNVTSPYIPEQADIWGVPDAHIEEIRPGAETMKAYVNTLVNAVGAPLKAPYKSAYRSDSYDKSSYETRHVLPFLIDIFSAAPRDMKVAWFGQKTELLERFVKAWSGLGFTNPVMLTADNDKLRNVPNTVLFPEPDVYDRADAFIIEFDSGADAQGLDIDHASRQKVSKSLIRALKSEYRRMEQPKLPLRRFIGVNTINNTFEGLFCSYVGAGATPFSSRIRHGFAFRPQKGEVVWFAARNSPESKIAASGTQIGAGGILTDHGIESRPDSNDCLCYGPYRALQSGSYRLRLNMEFAAGLGQPEPARPKKFGAFVEIAAGPFIIDARDFCEQDAQDGVYIFDFEVPDAVSEDSRATFEIRIRSIPGTKLVISRMSMECVSTIIADDMPDLLEAFSNSPRDLRVGWFGARDDAFERFSTAWIKSGFLHPVAAHTARSINEASDDPAIYDGLDAFVFAPHATLRTDGDPAGEGARSALTMQMHCAIRSEYARQEDEAETLRPFVGVRARNNSFEDQFRSRFTVDPSNARGRNLYGTVRAPAGPVKNKMPDYAVDWLGDMQIGAAGQRLGAAIQSKPGVEDFICYGPCRQLPFGRFKLELGLKFANAATGSPDADINPGALVTIVSDNRILGIAIFGSGDVQGGKCELAFDVPEALADNPGALFEIRIKPTEGAELTIERLFVERIRHKALNNKVGQIAVDVANLVPFLKIGSAGRRANGAIEAKPEHEGHIAFGPYWPLEPGAYVAEFSVEIGLNDTNPGSDQLPKIALEVVQNQSNFLVHQTLQGDEVQGSNRFSYPFSVPAGPAYETEFRIWTNGLAAIRLTSLKIDRAAEST